MLLLSLSVFFEAIVVLHGSRDCHPPILNFIAKKRQIITGFRGEQNERVQSGTNAELEEENLYYILHIHREGVTPLFQ